ncbi:VOC family protein [Streptomyces sp. NPDC046821]|uniref:VOC family protein n=1 Tax=Streptomyces sp. NPDC046821 TaxID=3154702 RepID=UPI0033DBB084
MSIRYFSHVGICVSDLDRSTRFYQEVFGFQEVMTAQVGNEFAATLEIDAPKLESRILGRDDVRIELLHYLAPGYLGDGSRRPMNQLGLTHLAFAVDDVTELFEATERAGGQVHHETLSVAEQLGSDEEVPLKTVYLTDPDGTRIELISGM